MRPLCALLLLFAATDAAAQSLAIGAEVQHAETISGVWESTLPSGKAVGLSIDVIATIDGHAQTLVGTPQTAKQVRFTAYVRTGDTTEQTLWFTGSAGDFAWTDNHLTVHADHTFRWSPPPAPLSLDLRFDPLASTWQGTMDTAGFSGTVTLKRPMIANPDPIVGVWAPRTSNQFGATCVHVAMGEAGHVVLWSDSLPAPGLGRYSNGLPPAALAYLSYGTFGGDPRERHHGDHWSFTTSSVASWTGGDVWDGVVSPDGATFSGEARHFGGGTYVTGSEGRSPFQWTRLPSGVCTDAFALPAIAPPPLPVPDLSHFHKQPVDSAPEGQ